MSDARIDDEVVEDLMNLTCLGLGIASAFAISSIMISSARAEADTHAASVLHHNHLASVELATMTECIAKILGTTGTTSSKALKEVALRAEQELYEAEMAKPVVT